MFKRPGHSGHIYKRTRSKSGDIYLKKEPIIEDFYETLDTFEYSMLRTTDDNDIYILNDSKTGASVHIGVFTQPINIGLLMGFDYHKVPRTNQTIKLAILALYRKRSKSGLVRKMMCNLLAHIYNSTSITRRDVIGLYACGNGPADDNYALISMYERMGFEICAVGEKRIYEKMLRNKEKTINEESDCIFGMSQTVGSLLDWCDRKAS
jgi:hypothetical protein